MEKKKAGKRERVLAKLPGAKAKPPEPEETTVSLLDGQGTVLIPPMSSSEFSQLANSIGKDLPVGESFFRGEHVRLSFVKFKPRMDKDGGRWLALTFSVPLSARLALACDSVIKSAYETIMDLDKLCPRVEIERVYKGFHVEFFATPLSEAPSLKLQNVNLGAIALERTPEIDALLHFSTEFPYRKDAGHWAVDNWGTAFWVNFKSANRNLFTESAEGGESPAAEESARAAAVGTDYSQSKPPLSLADDLDAHCEQNRITETLDAPREDDFDGA